MAAETPAAGAAPTQVPPTSVSPPAAPTPAPEQGEAFDITNAARDAMGDVSSFAFEMNITLKVQGSDVMMAYDGDGFFHYSSATLTLATPTETVDRKVIVADRSYVFDASTVS